MEAPAEAVFLDGRGLSELPESLRDNARLRHLDVRGNRLTRLPGWIAELRTLDLGHNRLAKLPAAIGRLTALETLYLADNRRPRPAPSKAPGRPRRRGPD